MTIEAGDIINNMLKTMEIQSDRIAALREENATNLAALDAQSMTITNLEAENFALIGKMNAMEIALTEEINAMKCCGNCNLYYQDTCQETTQPTHPTGYCDRWEKRKK